MRPDTGDDGHLHVYYNDDRCIRCGHVRESVHREAVRVGAYDDHGMDTMVSCALHVEWERLLHNDFTLADLESAVLAHVTGEDQ